MEWELSKENVQPLKRGRDVEALNKALRAKVDNNGGTREKIEEEQRDYILSIENYEGDDPLRPWLRYIKWLKASAPAADNSLLPVLEECTRCFQNDQNYKNDIRYLRVWIQYADCCSEPKDIFAFLETNDIGQEHALFYEAYATYLELRRNFSKANSVYELGLARRAEPVSRLASMFTSFQQRMVKRIQRKQQEEDEGQGGNEIPFTENDGGRSFGPVPGTSGREPRRNVSSQHQQARRKTQKPDNRRDGKQGFAIYVDEPFVEENPGLQHGPSIEQSKSTWEHLGTQKEVVKENVQQPIKWNQARVPQKNIMSTKQPPSLDVFVEEEFVMSESNKKQQKTSEVDIKPLRQRLEGVSSSHGLEAEALKHNPMLHFGGASGLAGLVSKERAVGSHHLPPKPAGKGDAHSPLQQAAMPGAPKAITLGFDPNLILQGDRDTSFEEARWQVWQAKHPCSPPRDSMDVSTTSKKEQSSQLQALVKEQGSKPKSLFSVFSDVAATGSRCTASHKLQAREVESAQPFEGNAHKNSIPSSRCQGLQSKCSPVDKVIVSTQVDRNISVARESILPGMAPMKQHIEMGEGHEDVESQEACYEADGEETMLLRKMGASPLAVADEKAHGSKMELRHEGRHGALVDPTINTKEALADILSQFNKPLPGGDVRDARHRADEVERHHESSPKRQKGQDQFEIFTDDDLDSRVSPMPPLTFNLQPLLAGQSSPRALRTLNLIANSEAMLEGTAQPLHGIRGRPAAQTSSPPGMRQTGHCREGGDSDVENQADDKELAVHRRSVYALQAGAAVLQPLGKERLEALRMQAETCSPSRGSSDDSEHGHAGSDGLTPNKRLQSAGDDFQDEFVVWSNDTDVQEVSERRTTTANDQVHPMTAPGLVSVDPWDPELRIYILSKIQPPLSSYTGYNGMWNSSFSGTAVLRTLKRSKGEGIIHLGAEEYQVKAFIGEGAYAKIYRAERCDAGLSGEEQEAEWADENTSVALKIQSPACSWEFYIYCQLEQRISPLERSCFGRARKIFAFSDCSVLVCDYKEHGSLQDVLNAYLAAGQQMDEALCIFYTIEMLRMLEILHAARILHGDFKPDNLMVREDSDQWDDWSPLTAGSWSQKGLYLIDWGRSIDLASLPKGAMLAGDSKTDAFRSPEMLEGRPWLYQVDTYGLCGVVHCLLHGRYMEVEKVAHSPVELPRYRPKARIKRYWNGELWTSFFDKLLNIEHNEVPPLASLRRAFQNHLESNQLKAKSLKHLLMKQNIMMFERPTLNK